MRELSCMFEVGEADSGGHRRATVRASPEAGFDAQVSALPGA
jgi:hypothetical protein